MKIKLIAGLVSGSLCFSALSLVANESPEVNVFRKALAGVTTENIPLKAVELVKQTRAEDREQATRNVMKAALEIKTVAALDVITAIGHSIPAMASIAAATFGEQQPRQAAIAARAAAVAAPATVGKIVESVCRSAPDDYRNIAVAVSQVAPASSREILDAVCVAIPETKASIKLSLLSYAGNISSVADVLDQANSIPKTKSAADSPAIAASAPTVFAGGPPLMPLIGTPANVGPKNSGLVPAGTRAKVAP